MVGGEVNKVCVWWEAVLHIEVNKVDLAVEQWRRGQVIVYTSR